MRKALFLIQVFAAGLVGAAGVARGRVVELSCSLRGLLPHLFLLGPRGLDALGGVALITADHGNADEMFEIDKKTKQPAQNPDGSFKAKTAHTLNPVPLILYDNTTGGKLSLKQTATAGLSNIAATVAGLLGLEKHASWDESLLEVSSKG